MSATYFDLLVQGGCRYSNTKPDNEKAGRLYLAAAFQECLAVPMQRQSPVLWIIANLLSSSTGTQKGSLQLLIFNGSQGLQPAQGLWRMLLSDAKRPRIDAACTYRRKRASRYDPPSCVQLGEISRRTGAGVPSARSEALRGQRAVPGSTKSLGKMAGVAGLLRAGRTQAQGFPRCPVRLGRNERGR